MTEATLATTNAPVTPQSARIPVIGFPHGLREVITLRVADLHEWVGCQDE